MSDKPLDADGQSEIVKQLIAEYKTRTDAGEQIPAEAWIAAHPEHAEELKRYFENGNEQSVSRQADTTEGDESRTGTSKAGKLSVEDATAHTIVQNPGDSESSLTQAYDQSGTGSVTSIEIPDSFGRYAIQKELGQGAMGAVYLARDTQLDRDVALKIPRFGDGNGVDDEELLARFYREARAAATLRSPNICPVYDVGEIEGQHYITMAFIEGRPLKDYTKSKKTHSEKQIITTIRKLALGLAEAHEIGVIHRDLKPANIMVDRKGEPVVMDFGLARRSSSDDVQVTQSGAIIGTPAYMAPEQVAGDQAAIDHQADIYALGVIMYELITGEMPFKGNLMALLQQIALNNPTKPSELRPDIDPRLEAICLKMIAGDREQRYQSMTDVATDLQEVLRNPDERHKQAQAKKKGAKPKSLPTAKEESNPALISIDRTKSSVVRMRAEQGKRSSSTGKATAASKSKSSGPSKHLMIAGGVGGLLLLLGMAFFVRDGRQDVQITLDDPSITISVDGETLNINDGSDVIQLSAGEHTLQLGKDGLKNHTEAFTVTKDGKTALRAVVVNGQLDALLNGEETPQIAARNPSATSQTKKAAWQGWPADAPPTAVAPFDAAKAKTHQQAWADYLGVPVEYENSIGMKFRLIPPGEFMMGSTPEEIEAALEVAGEDEAWREKVNSEGPQHKVVLTQPIYVGVTEVKQSQYEQVMGTNPSYFSATGEGKDSVANLETDNHPVETVSWNDTAEFCAKLSQQEKLKPFYLRSGETVTPLDGTGYRLPTEAEWEHACRAGTTTRFWSGDEDQDLVSAGWFKDNSESRTHAAGELKANPFGLPDVHGNVFEWVQDSWDSEFYGKFQGDAAVDPSSPFTAGPRRVLRGGYWHNYPSYCRSSTRGASHHWYRKHNIGFRVVLPVDAVKRPSNSTASSVSSGNFALKFDGERTKVDIPDFPSLGAGPMTVEAIVRIDQPDKLSAFLMSRSGWRLFVNMHGGVSFWFATPDGMFKTWTSESDAPTGNRLYHLAGVIDGPESRIYVDGRRIRTDPLVGPARDLSEQPGLTIGYELKDGQPNHFAGMMDELRISNTARYNDDFNPPTVNNRWTADANTVGLYHFDDGTGDVLKDSSGNGHDGKIVGANWVKVDEDSNVIKDEESEADFPVGSMPYILTSDEYEWTEPVNLATLNTSANDQHPWISEDGLTLMFSTMRDDGEGGGDIWQTTRKTVADEWSEPLNLGAPINTLAYEGAPGLSNNGRTLIFQSSRQQGGYGGMDLWMSSRKSPTDPWIEPFNLGEVINSPAAESLPILSEDGRSLVFHSNRLGAFNFFCAIRQSLDDEWSQPTLLTGTSPVLETYQPYEAGRILWNARSDIALLQWDLQVERWLPDGLIDSSINTKSNAESQQVFHRATNTLYWVSDRPGGMGESDIWMARRVRKGKPTAKRISTNSADTPPPSAVAPFDENQAKAHQQAWAEYLGVPVEYENSIGMKFHLIPPGEFMMGSTPEEIETTLKEIEERRQSFIKSQAPQHKVVLTQPIYVGVTEVTQAQYKHIMGANPSHFATTGKGKDTVAGLETGNHPVESVSWNDAAEFCTKLSQQEELKPFYFRSGENVTSLDGTGYRLPTEAEWEFTCRAGTTTLFWSGEEEQDLSRAGWYAGKAGGRTHAVGELKANPFGLSDMHGNVWELVQDSWDSEFYGKFQGDAAVDPSSPFTAGPRCVSRGGSWNYLASNCRSSTRNAPISTYRTNSTGFRVVLPVDAVKQIFNK